MNADLFFVDPISRIAKSYFDLQTDSGYVPEVGMSIRLGDLYPFYVNLWAAVARHASVVLLPSSSNDAVLNEMNRNDSLGLNERGPQHNALPRLSSVSQIAESRASIGLMSSGTSGKPKIIWHSIGSLLRGVVRDDRHRGDVWGLTYHPAHIAGLQVFLQAVANRNPLIRLFDLDGSLASQAIVANEVSHISATPTFLRLLCSMESAVFPTVTRVTTGGERLDETLRLNLTRVFPNAKLRNVYASTEAGTVLLSDGETFKIPSEKSDVVKLIDGQLAIHHSLLAESFRAALEKRGSLLDGFYLTGDFVEPVGNDGAFRFLPRHDRQINVGGYKVNSADVENALRQLPDIADTIVYGVDNSVTGSIVACDVVLKPTSTLTARDIRSRLRERLTPYELPALVNIVPALQKTFSGKQAGRS